MKKVLISGFYGYGNGGDEAVLSGIIHSLKEAGITDITVLSGNTDYTRSLHNVNAVPKLSPATLSAIMKCDIFISGGGSLLQNTTSNKSLYYYLALLKTAQMFGKKTVIFAQGIGPISGTAHISNMMAILKKADMISVRDKDSQILLNNAGISASILPDPAYLCKKIFSESYLRNMNITRDFIAVCPRPWKDNSYLKNLNEAVSEYSSSHGLDTICIPMFYEEDRLLNDFPTPASKLNFMEQRGIISKARLVVSVRLHSMIFASAESIPFVPISYDPKTEAFAKQVGNTPLDINSFSQEELISAMEDTKVPDILPDTDRILSFAKGIAQSV